MNYTLREANTWTGRVVRRAGDGLAYTVTSCSTYGNVSVWNPATQTLYRFDSRETFEYWLHGTPVEAAGPV